MFMVLVGQLREKCSQRSILNISHTHTHTHKMEEVKMKEMQLYQLKKKIAENESKLKQQYVTCCGQSLSKLGGKSYEE